MGDCRVIPVLTGIVSGISYSYHLLHTGVRHDYFCTLVHHCIGVCSICIRRLLLGLHAVGSMIGWRTLCHPAYRGAQMGEREAPNTRTDVTYPSWAMPAAVVAIAMLDFENEFYIRIRILLLCCCCALWGIPGC